MNIRTISLLSLCITLNAATQASPGLINNPFNRIAFPGINLPKRSSQINDLMKLAYEYYLPKKSTRRNLRKILNKTDQDPQKTITKQHPLVVLLKALSDDSPQEITNAIDGIETAHERSKDIGTDFTYKDLISFFPYESFKYWAITDSDIWSHIDIDGVFKKGVARFREQEKLDRQEEALDRQERQLDEEIKRAEEEERAHALAAQQAEEEHKRRQAELDRLIEQATIARDIAREKARLRRTFIPKTPRLKSNIQPPLSRQKSNGAAQAAPAFPF